MCVHKILACNITIWTQRGSKRKEMIMIRANAFIELTRHRDDLEINFKITIRCIRYKASNFGHVSYMI
jgi:hypothetical protein